MTDFFHISESNIVETTSSNPTALGSSSSDCIPEPEPICFMGTNLKTKSSNVSEDEAHRVKETI